MAQDVSRLETPNRVNGVLFPLWQLPDGRLFHAVHCLRVNCNQRLDLPVADDLPKPLEVIIETARMSGWHSDTEGYALCPEHNFHNRPPRHPEMTGAEKRNAYLAMRTRTMNAASRRWQFEQRFGNPTPPLQEDVDPMQTDNQNQQRQSYDKAKAFEASLPMLEVAVAKAKRATMLCDAMRQGLRVATELTDVLDAADRRADCEQAEIYDLRLLARSTDLQLAVVRGLFADIDMTLRGLAGLAADKGGQ